MFTIVLAVFIGGSLVAMVSFACPLEDMMYIMGGSYLIAAFLRAFYLLYQPFRPKYLVQEGNVIVVSLYQAIVTQCFFF